MTHRFIHRTGLDVVVATDPLCGGFYGVVPALPGCGSQGETIKETLINLDDAVMLVLSVIEQDEPDRLALIFGSTTQFQDEDDDGASDSTAGDTAIISAAA